MPTELVTVNLTRENENEAWGFQLAGGGRDKNVRLYIEEVSFQAKISAKLWKVLQNARGRFVKILQENFPLLVLNEIECELQ